MKKGAGNTLHTTVRYQWCTAKNRGEMLVVDEKSSKPFLGTIPRPKELQVKNEITYTTVTFRPQELDCETYWQVLE